MSPTRTATKHVLGGKRSRKNGPLALELDSLLDLLIIAVTSPQLGMEFAFLSSCEESQNSPGKNNRGGWPGSEHLAAVVTSRPALLTQGGDRLGRHGARTPWAGGQPGVLGLRWSLRTRVGPAAGTLAHGPARGPAAATRPAGRRKPLPLLCGVAPPICTPGREGGPLPGGVLEVAG